MDPLDGPETFYSLTPELRNIVYRLHFDATTTAIDHNDVKPKRKGRVRAIRYTPADSLHEAVSIFLASHLVYNETRGLFLLDRENEMGVHLTGPIAKLDWSLIPSMRYAKEQKGWQVSGAVGTGGLERSRRRRRRSWFGEDERPETAALVDPREKGMSEVQKLCFEAWQELEEYLSKPEGVEGRRVDKAIVKEL